MVTRVCPELLSLVSTQKSCESCSCRALGPSTLLSCHLCGLSPPHPWPPVFMATSICRALGALVRTGRVLDAHCVPSPSLAVQSLSWCHAAPQAPCPAVPSVGPCLECEALDIASPGTTGSSLLPHLLSPAHTRAGVSCWDRAQHPFGPTPHSVPVCKSQRARPAPVPGFPCSQGEPGSAPGRCHQPGLPQHAQGRSLCRQLRGQLPGGTWSCFFCVLSI